MDDVVEELRPNTSPYEIDLAERFAERHAGALRYVSEVGSWYLYKDGRWRRENTLLAFDLARQLCVEVSQETKKEPKALRSAKTVAAVERLARADRRLAATAQQWDADPWLLNTPAGTIDLRTGKMRPHDPADYITKMTAVAPDGKGECPQWKAHLNLVFQGDQTIIDFLQGFFGYCLTGDTSQDIFCFAYGQGRAGKNTTIDTVADIFGDYHCTAQMDTFTASNVERHPTGLAMLHGARLVTANETEEGKRWNERLLKDVTGGGKITAHFMRQDDFTYVAQFKLTFLGNHKPGLRSVDGAIRERIRLIPFDFVIPPEDRDPHFPEKLREEWSGILQWMIDGCLAWQRDGLKVPDKIRAATDQYLEEEDSFLAWFETNCERDKGAETETMTLFADYKSYCEAANEWVCKLKQFSQKLEDHSTQLGLRKRTNPTTRRSVFRGVKLRADRIKPVF
jgi:putative DNA primase/helicase